MPVIKPSRAFPTWADMHRATIVDRSVDGRLYDSSIIRSFHRTARYRAECAALRGAVYGATEQGLAGAFPHCGTGCYITVPDALEPAPESEDLATSRALDRQWACYAVDEAFGRTFGA